MPYPLVNPPNDGFPLRCTRCGHHCGYADVLIMQVEGVECPEHVRGGHNLIEI